MSERKSFIEWVRREWPVYATEMSDDALFRSNERLYPPWQARGALDGATITTQAAEIDRLNGEISTYKQALYDETEGITANLRNDRIDELEAGLARDRAEVADKQAEIDRLMLEYCPDDMTPEQIAEWGKRQGASEQGKGDGK